MVLDDRVVVDVARVQDDVVADGGERRDDCAVEDENVALADPRWLPAGRGRGDVAQQPVTARLELLAERGAHAVDLEVPGCDAHVVAGWIKTLGKVFDRDDGQAEQRVVLEVRAMDREGDDRELCVMGQVAHIRRAKRCAPMITTGLMHAILSGL